VGHAILAALMLTGVVLARNASELQDPGAAQAATTQTQPTVLFSGLDLPEGARYSVTVHPSTTSSISNARVEVVIPTDAVLLEARHTPGRTVFIGVSDGVLTWMAPGYGVGEPVDPFPFLLARPLTSEVQVRVSWDADETHVSAQFATRPSLSAPVRAAEGAVTLTGTGPADPSVEVLDTGVQLIVSPGAVTDGTTLRLTRMAPDANPPSGIGSPWWCAALRVEGLPPGEGVFVLVPARQVLPAGQPVTLFAQRENGWEQLDQYGYATADGQYVGFLHPGGLVAAGVPSQLQPQLFSVLSPPKLTVSVTGTFTIRNFESASWTIKVKNTGSRPANRVYVYLQGPFGVDFHNISLSGSALGFTCRIVDGLAFPSSATAECSGQQLGVGQEITIKLNGGTTFVPASLTSRVFVRAQDNYPDAHTTRSDVEYGVAVNNPP
jgi:hypothetical protein